MLMKNMSLPAPSGDSALSCGSTGRQRKFPQFWTEANLGTGYLPLATLPRFAAARPDRSAGVLELRGACELGAAAACFFVAVV